MDATMAQQLPLFEAQDLPSVIVNTSGFKPLGRAVLVRPYEPKKKASMIVMPDSVNERATMVESRAIVIEVGEACWPDEPARAKPGDHVMISKMAGWMGRGPADDQIYRLVNDRDIFCAITHIEE